MLENVEQRDPGPPRARRDNRHIGWLLVHSRDKGPFALGRGGAHHLASGRIEGEDPLAAFSPAAPAHLLRTDGFTHVADIMVGSFYEAELDEGCAFEELISFHGGLGGPQTRPFLLYPRGLPAPGEPLIGAAAVHEVLAGWRLTLHSRPSPEEFSQAAHDQQTAG